jgi:hypothetical protein
MDRLTGKGELRELVGIIMEPTSKMNPKEVKFQKKLSSLSDEEFVTSLYGALSIIPAMRQAVIDNTPEEIAQFTVPVLDKLLEALAVEIEMPGYAKLVLTSEPIPRLTNKQRGGAPAQGNVAQQLIAAAPQGAARAAISGRVADLIDAAADVKELQLKQAKHIVLEEIRNLRGWSKTLLVAAMTAALQVILFFFVFYAAGVAGGFGTVVLLITFWLVSGAAALAASFSIPGIISGLISLIIATSGGVVSGAVGGVATGAQNLFTGAASMVRGAAATVGIVNKNKIPVAPTEAELNAMRQLDAISAERRRHEAVKLWISGLAQHIANVREEWDYLLSQFIEVPQITLVHRVAVGFLCYIVLFVTVQRIHEMYIVAKTERSNKRLKELMGNADALLEASIKQQLQAQPQFVMLQQPPAQQLLGAPAVAQPLLAAPAAQPLLAAPAQQQRLANAAPAGGRRRNKKTRSKKSNKRRMTKRR